MYRPVATEVRVVEALMKVDAVEEVAVKNPAIAWLPRDEVPSTESL